MKRNDLTGQRFGRLIAVEYVGNSRWRCKCDCGNGTIVLSGNLIRGHTTSCGCARGKWQASIRFKGHKYNLGRYDNIQDAIDVRQAAEREIFGNFLEWYENKGDEDEKNYQGTSI